MSEGEGDLKMLQSAIEDFSKAQKAINETLASTQQRLDANFKIMDGLCSQHKSQQNELKRMHAMMKQMERSGDSDKFSEQLQEHKLALAAAEASLDVLRKATPRNDSHFVRFAMGKVNVKLWKRNEQLNFRDEYNKFKRRTTYVFILFPLLQLLVLNNKLTWTLHQAWLLYYYISLALRENILRCNGSSIKMWWIYHHYVTSVLCATLLVWPPGDDFQQARGTPYLMFALSQGIIMFLTNRYQSKRAYVRKSLGKAKEIDVDHSETLVEKPTDLKFISVLLFGLYAVEMAMGLDLFYFFFLSTSYYDSVAVLIMAGCLVVLGLGNTITTSLVLMSKSQRRKVGRGLRKLGIEPSGRRRNKIQ